MNGRTIGSVIGLLAFSAGFFYCASSPATTIYGYDHTAAGNAALDVDINTGRVRLDNLGSSGQDGVAINLSSAPQSSSYSLDVQLDPLGTAHSNGSFFESAQTGSIGGGANQLLSTVEAAQISSTDYAITSDFSPSDTGGLPLTINYYSGGPNGTLIYSEPFGGTNPSFIASSWPDTWYVDAQLDPPVVSAGVDFKNGGGAAFSARGVQLSTTADFIDILAPTSGAVRYSSMALTAGGGDISSFTINSEITSVPEPSTILLACGGAVLICLARRS